jgi:hypothetical protein
MHRSHTRSTIRLGTVALSFLLAALLLSSVLTAAAQTESRDDEAALHAAFASLRTTFVEEVPTPLQPAFLAKVDAAEIALLLPAVQAAREEARARGCAAQQILEALRHRVQIAGESGRGLVVFSFETASAETVNRAIDVVVSHLACPRGA